MDVPYSQKNTIWRCLRLLALVACSLTILVGLLSLLETLFIQLRAPIFSDGGIYYGVGNGIVHGLVPYRDLFETKPVGIFLLNAISIVLTGDWILVNIVYVLSIGALPPLIGVIVWNVSDKLERNDRIFLLFAILGIAFAITLLIADLTAQKQTEAYGFFWVIVFLLCIVQKRMELLTVVLAGVAIFFAGQFKETCALMTLLAALLFVRDRKHLIMGWIVPGFIAMTLQVLFLAALGFFIPYITIYLPHIFGHHITRHASPFVQALWWSRLDPIIARFAPLFPAALGGLAILSLLIRYRWRHPVLGITGFLVAGYALWILIFIDPLIHFITTGAFQESPFPSPLGLWGLILLLYSFCILAFSIQNEKRLPLLRDGARLLVWFYFLGFVMVLGGDFLTHHMVYAPLGAIMLCIAVATHLHTPSPVFRRYVLCILAALSIVLTATRIPTESILPFATKIDEEMTAAANRLDRLLTACDQERYLSLDTPLWMRTQHMPLGPGFMDSFTEENLNPAMPVFAESFNANMRTAFVVLTRKPEQEAMILSYGFEKHPPACAVPFLPIAEGYDIYFR